MSKLPAVTHADHTIGPADAPVTLVEYADFQCPYCGQAYPIVERVREALGDRLRFVFRHFPLEDAHPHALGAAVAAEAAAAQGRFWEMHALLFTHQTALLGGNLVHYAERIGLDVAAFRHALGDARLVERVRAQALGGEQAGVDGTPAFFIDGARFEGSWDEATLTAALAARIARA